MGLEVGGMGGAEEEEEEEKEEKIPHVCESIGHRPPSGSLPCSPLNFNHRARVPLTI